MEAYGGDLVLSTSSGIQTLFDSFSGAQENEIIYVDAETGKKYTYLELFKNSVRTAEGLKSLGLGRGDVVTVAAHPTFEAVSVVFGIWFSGATYNPVNPQLLEDEISAMISTTKPKLIYCGYYIPVVEKLAKSKNIKIFSSLGQKENHLDLNKWILSPSNDFVLSDIVSEEHVACILFTSGTSGFPKAVQLGDRSIKTLGGTTPLPRQTCLLLTSPLFWISSTMIFCSGVLSKAVLVTPSFPVEEDTMLAAMEIYRPDAIFVSPSAVISLTSRPDIPERDFSYLKVAVVGGSPISVEQKHKIVHKLFKGRYIINVGYGSTEAGIVATWPEGVDPQSEQYKSVGTLVKGVRMKVVDVKTGNPLGPNKEGEVYVKTSGMLLGILQPDGVSTSGTDSEGWFHTGDLGYYDTNNFVYISGRLKDIMKYRNYQIAPAEIEKIIDQHPEVIESCVVGKPDEVCGELPTALVVKQKGSPLTEQELSNFVAERVVDPKKLRGGVYFIDSLPKNPVGKVLTKKVLEILKQGLIK